MFLRSMTLAAGVAAGLLGFTGAVRADDFGDIPPDQPRHVPPSTRPLDPNKDWGNLDPQKPPEKKDQDSSKTTPPPKQGKKDEKKDETAPQRTATEPPTQRKPGPRHNHRPITQSIHRSPSLGHVPSVKGAPSISKRSPRLGHFGHVKSIPGVSGIPHRPRAIPRFSGHRSWGGDGKSSVGVQVRQPKPPVKKEAPKGKGQDDQD